MTYLIILAVLLFAFLFGSIPTAYVIVKATLGQDITMQGSKNCGATNARRVTDIHCGNKSRQGTFTFYAVILLDALKGAIPVIIAMKLFSNYDNRLMADILIICTAALAVLGHDIMPLFKRGSGKGVATSAGAIFVFAPIPTLIAAVIFFSARVLTETVSRRSIAAAIAHPIACVITGVALPFILGSIFLVALLILRHKENIKRIIKGKE